LRNEGHVAVAVVREFVGFGFGGLELGFVDGVGEGEVGAGGGVMMMVVVVVVVVVVMMMMMMVVVVVVVVVVTMMTTTTTTQTHVPAVIHATHRLERGRQGLVLGENVVDLLQPVQDSTRLWCW